MKVAWNGTIGLIACSVFEREIALHRCPSVRLAATEFLEIGLHDRPDTLRGALQAAIDRIDQREDISAIVLLYGLCGLGTAGLVARRYPIVIPRAHDCITVFMGSKERFARHHRSCPGCFYYTPGWNRNGRVPGPGRLEYLRTEYEKRFEAEDVEFLLSAEKEQWGQHSTAVFLDLGTDDAWGEAQYARSCARWLGWKFEWMKGDPSLLRDLLAGRWDSESFQMIHPGSRLLQTGDEWIMRTEPAPTEYLDWSI